MGNRLVILLLLLLVPLPLLFWLSEAAIREVEAADRRLREERVCAELTRDLVAALDAPGEPGESGAVEQPLAVTRLVWGPRLPLSETESRRIEVRAEPDAAYLASPALLRARHLIHEGQELPALEELRPLLRHRSSLGEVAAGSRISAEIFLALGHGEKGRALIHRALQRLEGTLESPIESEDAEQARRRSRLQGWLCLSEEILFGSWSNANQELERALHEVESGPTDREEMILIGDLLRLARERRKAGFPSLEQRWGERRAWPRWVAWLRAATEGRAQQGPCLWGGGLGWFVTRITDGVGQGTEPGTMAGFAWRLQGLDVWLRDWQGPGGARVIANQANSERSLLAMPTVLSSGPWSLRLGERSLSLHVPVGEVFGKGNPRVVLGFGLLGYAVLALLLTRALHRRQRESVRLAALRGELIAEVTHELRTPLTVLRMYAESLERGRVPPAARDHYLATIQRESRRLGDLVDRVAEVARGEARDETGERRWVDVRELVNRLVGEVRAIVEVDGGRLLVAPLLAESSPSPSAGVLASEEELRRIVEILLDNAVRYSPPPVRLEIEVALREGRVRIVVLDHGPGVPSDEREQVFEPWTRGQSGRASGTRGAGMGLSLARRTARDLGGDVTLEFPAEGGTRAVVSLPAAARREA